MSRKDRQHIRDAHRRNLRWYILRMLDAARRYGVSETTMLRALTDAHLSPTPSEIRDELTYLDDCGLLTLEREGPEWAAKIKPAGTDIVNYDADCPKGIGRPPQYLD